MVLNANYFAAHDPTIREPCIDAIRMYHEDSTRIQKMFEDPKEADSEELIEMKVTKAKRQLEMLIYSSPGQNEE